MNNIIYYLLILSLIGGPNSSEYKNVYLVKKTTKELKITGYGTDSSWNDAVVLSEFIYPWNSDEPPGTEFKALWSDTHFYFLFKVVDREIITPQNGLGERDAVNSDRVEIFFKSNDINKPYYSLEMDALGRCLDTEGVFGDYIEFDWNWPKDHFILKASQQDHGYIVEGSISLSSLRELGMYTDDKILHAGVYRGDYSKKSDGKTAVKWISWVKPASKSFHIPSSFGIFKLLD